MANLFGENWQGMLSDHKTNIARGSINGYSWCFVAKSETWVLEIAEDQGIDPESLPLVGFGCAGWLYESTIDPELHALSPAAIERFLSEGFKQFDEGKLQHIPDVPCSCSDFKIF